MKNFRLQRMNQITSMGFIGFELAFLKASRVKCNASPSRRLLKTMSCARTVSFSVLNAGKLSCWVHGTVQGGMGTWLLWHSTHNWAVLSFVFTPRAIMPRLSASTMASRHCLNTSDSWQHKHSISVATATPPNPGTLNLMSVKVCYEKQKSTDSYNTFYFHSIPSVVVEEKFPSQLDDIFFFFFLISY